MSMPRQSGFTLIELMVVVVIIGIASATISLSIKPDPAALLRKDAERLAQLFQIAQAEARADGRMISWHADAKGFAFRRRAETGPGHDTFNGDPQLRPRNWESPAMRVRVHGVDRHAPAHTAFRRPARPRSATQRAGAVAGGQPAMNTAPEPAHQHGFYLA